MYQNYKRYYDNAVFYLFVQVLGHLPPIVKVIAEVLGEKELQQGRYILHSAMNIKVEVHCTLISHQNYLTSLLVDVATPKGNFSDRKKSELYKS